MALNITFDGFAYDNAAVLGNSNIYYQSLFYPSTTASSPSKWNTVRIVEATGYYNINLGSADWLSQEGTALSGAKVIIVFWRGAADRNADCSLVTQWGAFEITLTGAAFYSQDAQIKTNILPTLSWYHNIPAHGYVNTNYNLTNNSDDVHSWEFHGATMYHWYSRFGHIINGNNTIDSTDYDWGNGEDELDLPGASNTSYQWDTAGTYDITITVRDVCGDEVTATDSIDIFWHVPSPNIVRCDSAGNTLSNIIDMPDTEVFFKYSGTGSVDTITAIAWTINDSGVYGNTNTVITKDNVVDIIAHTEGNGTDWLNHVATEGAFTNPGSHTVSMVVSWDDGFEIQTINYSETFTQQRFDNPPSADIVCNEAINNNVSVPSTVLSFNYIGTNPESRITAIDWTIEDSGAYGNTNTVVMDKALTDTILHSNGEGASWCGNLQTLGAFTNPGNHTVTAKVNWNDGWDDNIVTRNETISQGKFSGPNISFTQAPAQATLASGVSFSNTSSNTDRVGLGLPNCEEYMWTWVDAGIADIETNKPYDYDFVKVPTTASCSVELCAEWSDGWDTKTTCVTKDVVFGTTITVSAEECYYALDIIGTSSDGTIGSYNWTVASGASENGPWSLVWESPTDIDQQHKTLCFTITGWYKVEGFVNGSGTTTSDDEVMFISETCPDTSAMYNIWNGTGILDIGSDWLRSGVGTELAIAKYRGTNGLEVDVDKNDEFSFYKNNYVDVDTNDYDFLSFWINLQEWDFKKDVSIKLFATSFTTGVDLNLSNYIATSSFNTWTRILIPLSHFGLKPSDTLPGWPTMVNRIRFHVKDNIRFWLDNVAFSMGALVAVPVCAPGMATTEFGTMTTYAENIGAPTPTASEVGVPGMKPIGTIQPTIKIIKPFPEPINL